MTLCRRYAAARIDAACDEPPALTDGDIDTVINQLETALQRPRRLADLYTWTRR